MRKILFHTLACIGAGVLSGPNAFLGASADIEVTVDSGSPGFFIPPDFSGLSFELSHLLPDRSGRHFFAPDNQAVVKLFKSIGIRNLRVGGGTAEDRSNRIPAPSFADIDALFAFAAAADVKVIYTLRLFNGDLPQDVAVARYIVAHYSARLSYFSLGNEPDWKSYHVRTGYTAPAGIFPDNEIFETVPGVPGTAYPSFLKKWRRFVDGVVVVVPTARFGGPDTGSNFPLPGTIDTDTQGVSWSQKFAEDEGKSGRLVEVDHHDYVGESATGVAPDTASNDMLSREWSARRYPALYEHVFRPIIQSGLRYRMTECNDYTGGVDGASNTFVSALWALDYMHWQAEHGASGVNFHNKRWLFTDTILPDASGRIGFNPKAYAIAAFNLGSEGSTEPVKLQNPAAANVTVYAVRGRDGHFVTIINKEHGSEAPTVRVTLDGIAGAVSAAAMPLVVAAGNLSARTGITLGGAALDQDQSWQGTWNKISRDADGGWTTQVPPSSAVILRISAR